MPKQGQFGAKYKHARRQIDCKLCCGGSLGTKICSRTGMHIYNIITEKICLNTNQKKLPLICFCMQICLANPNVHTHCFAQKNRCTQSLTPKLHGRSEIIVSNNIRCHLLLLIEKQINTTLD